MTGQEEIGVGKKIRSILPPLLFWVAVWQLLSARVGAELLLPAPLTVVERLWELGGTAAFWLTAGATLGRIFTGFLAGVLLGGILAVLTFASRWADRLLSPAIRVIRATPVASFIILILLWVERGRVPGLISALMVLPVVWGNVSRGLREVDPQLLELAQAYRFGRGKTAGLIYFPSARPYFTSACRTSMGLAWKAGVAAEVLCLPVRAVGTQVYYSKIYLETPTLFAWTLVVVVLSFLLERLMDVLLRHLEQRRAGHDKAA